MSDNNKELIEFLRFCRSTVNEGISEEDVVKSFRKSLEESRNATEGLAPTHFIKDESFKVNLHEVSKLTPTEALNELGKLRQKSKQVFKHILVSDNEPHLRIDWLIKELKMLLESGFEIVEIEKEFVDLDENSSGVDIEKNVSAKLVSNKVMNEKELINKIDSITKRMIKE